MQSEDYYFFGGLGGSWIVSAKVSEMLDDTWSPAMLMFLELPWLVICKLGIAGRAGIDFGSPPSNFSVNVALSVTVMVSRSSVAVKVAPAPATGAQQTVKPRTETPLNRANIDRRPIRKRQNAACLPAANQFVAYL